MRFTEEYFSVEEPIWSNDEANVELPDFTASLSNEVKGLKIGIPKEYFGKGLDTSVEKAVQEAIQTLESMGLQTVEVSLPHTEYAVATYYILACAEASANLSMTYFLNSDTAAPCMC